MVQTASGLKRGSHRGGDRVAPGDDGGLTSVPLLSLGGSMFCHLGSYGIPVVRGWGKPRGASGEGWLGTTPDVVLVQSGRRDGPASMANSASGQ